MIFKVHTNQLQKSFKTKIKVNVLSIQAIDQT